MRRAGKEMFCCGRSNRSIGSRAGERASASRSNGGFSHRCGPPNGRSSNRMAGMDGDIFSQSRHPLPSAHTPEMTARPLCRSFDLRGGAVCTLFYRTVSREVDGLRYAMRGRRCSAAAGRTGASGAGRESERAQAVRTGDSHTAADLRTAGLRIAWRAWMVISFLNRDIRFRARILQK